MDRRQATSLLDRLHDAQSEFYSGGHDASLRLILAHDVVWSVPGINSIAGTYRGLQEVVEYFGRRRDLAAGTFRMQRRDVLVGQGRRVAALTDGTATIRGQAHQWSTVGLYDIDANDHISACWLLPLDQEAFDRIWTA